VGERRHELTEAQWQLVADLLPPAKAKGRPPRSARQMLNGMMWILMTGAPWRDLPERYGPWETVYRRFREWARAGVFDRVLKRLQLQLDEDGHIDWSEVYIDGSSVRASAAAAGAPKKGGPGNRRTTR
jgi:transposase